METLLDALTNNIAPLLALMILHSALLPRLQRRERGIEVLFGLLFGATAVLGIAFPFTLAEGLIFDGRSVVLCLAGFFAGPLAGVIAALITAAVRIEIGGPGVWMGLGVIATSTGLGIVFRRQVDSGKAVSGPLLFLALSFAVHAGSLLWMLALPAGVRAVTLWEVAGSFLGVLTVSTWVLAQGFQLGVTRAAAQDAAARSERLLLDAQRAARIGSFVLEIGDGRWTAPDIVDEIFGIGPEYPHTLDGWTMLIAPEQREPAAAHLRQVLARGDRFELEYPIIRCNDGARRWLHAAGRVECGVDGRPQRMIGFVQDVTERKDAELSARSSEHLFRSLVGAIPDLLWLKDADGVYRVCNPAFERFFGAREAEIVGKTDFDFVDRELATFFRQKDRDAMAAGRPTMNEETLTIAADGSTIRVETIKTPLVGADGRLLGVLGIARDITARKQVEQALQRSEALHAQAQRVGQIGHWALNHVDGRLQWSDETYRIFEREPGSAVSYSGFIEAVHPDDRKMVEDAFGAAIDTGTPYAIVHRVLIGDRIKYVEERAETLYDADGALQRSVGTVQDVTKRRQAELELERELRNTRMMLDTMTDGYVRTDIDGRILDVNPAYCRMLGYERGELIGRNLADLKLPGSEREVPGRIADILASGPMRFMTRHRRKDGRTIDIDASAASMPRAEPPQLAAFFRDVTHERRVESHYHELVDRIPAGVFRYRSDAAGGHFEYVSPLFCTLLQVDEREAQANPETVFRRLPPEDISTFSQLRAAARSETRPFSWEGRLDVGDRSRWLRVEAGPTAEAEGELVWHGIVTDITERQQLLDRLRMDSAVIASTVESIMITDLDATIVSVNPAFSAVTGYSAEEAIGQNARMLRSGRHDAAFYQDMFRALREVGHWQGQIWNRRKSGELYPELLNVSIVRDAAGRPTHYVGVATDITQLKRSEEQLQHLAHHDALTSLPNRLLVGSRLEHALERARRDNVELAVMFLDLDRFKTVNDSLGHEIGDQLLVAVAQRMKSQLREEDTLGRLGGDEFVILLEHVGSSMAAAKVARKLLGAFEQPFKLAGGHELYIQASIGIAAFPADGRSAEILIRNADTAMFRAKEQGRNTYQFYTEALTAAASGRLHLETRIRQGIRDGEFQVWYQPIYRFAERRIVGAEALMRWPLADGTMVSPDQFIPVAEDSGLIVELGRRVLETSCRDLRRWLDQGLDVQTLAVNLSAQQFHTSHFERSVARKIAMAHVPAQILELEITERGLMDLGHETLRKLHALKALGVRLAIDDFGTGYSSLTYLKRMPVDKLKIDRSFVDHLPADASDAAIVHTIVAIARTLKLKVLAEGVETPDQLAFLRDAGCDECQGFLFGPAVPAERFAEQLRDQAGPAQP